MPKEVTTSGSPRQRVTKHANGEGGIRKRKDGRYEARLTLSDGKRMSICGSTREEVATSLATAISDRNKGLPVAIDGKQTVRQYLEGWLAAIKGNVRPKTFTGYEIYVRLHTVPTLGKTRIAKLTPQQLQALYSKKLEEGLSPTTVFHIHATIHRALQQAVRWGVIARNVAGLVDPPRRTRQEMKTYSSEQARILLDAAVGERLEALYILAITTGMRQGELLGLRWKDVDLDEQVLRVRATMQRTKEGLTFCEPKTAGSRRQIALTSQAITALRRHRANQAEERLRMGPSWEDKDLVFCTANGRPIEATNLLRRSFKPLLKKAGLPNLRFHDLRHTAATICLKKKVPAKVVSEMLGHSRIAITLDTYSHVLPDMQREATAAMEAALWG
jgi:integrase